MNTESMKELEDPESTFRIMLGRESEDPESMRVFRIVSGRESEVRVRVRDLGLERVDVLSVAFFA